MYLGQLICPTFPDVRKYLVVSLSFLAGYNPHRVPCKAISTPSENQNINKHEVPSGKKKKPAREPVIL